MKKYLLLVVGYIGTELAKILSGYSRQHKITVIDKALFIH